MSVLNSKDVLGRPPKTHSNPRSEGLQNVQEGAYDMMFLGAHESYALTQALRTTEDWSKCRHIFRFDACLLRARSLTAMSCFVLHFVRLAFDSGLMKATRSRI